MKSNGMKISTLVLVLTLLCPAFAEASPKKLVGKWQVSAMEREGKRMDAPQEMQIFIEFAAKGKFFATMKAEKREEKEEGTYKATGNQLTTVVKDKTETMTFTVKGKELILTKKLKDHMESMILKKVK